MKSFCFKAVLVIVCSLSYVKVNAQQWCPPGAKFVYSTYYYLYNGYEEYVYEGDSLFADGVLAHKLKGSWSGYSPILDSIFVSGPWLSFTYSSNDVIYVRDYYDEWDTLFNFQLGIGGRWNLPHMMQFDTAACDSNSHAIVLDTGRRIIQGHDLRWQYVNFIHRTGQPWHHFNYVDTIYERIGTISTFLFPTVNCWIEGGKGELRCYSDSTFPEYTSGWTRSLNRSCYHLFSTYDEKLEEPHIFPNPTDRYLFLTDGTNAPYQIINGHGQTVQQGEVDEYIDVSTLPEGLYILLIDKRVYRFMKTAY